MKKFEYIIFVVLCLLFCIVPSVGMSFGQTEVTTENRTLASLPEWKKGNEWNQDYFEEFGGYFEDHFAFRNAFVAADSIIQSEVFRVSNVDTVIVGEEGWLYYYATLSDYKGENLMSERALYNAAHNMQLMQDFVNRQGGEFYLTIAPNKNSLYGEYMPYYVAEKVSSEKNIVSWVPMLKELGVSYVDLFELFENEEEILYMERDSHWNNKGAVAAYNKILEAAGKEHQTYQTVPVTRRKDAYGDLNRMVYPYGGKPEWDYQYNYDWAYRYVTDTQSVEDAWIETENEGKEGSLLMFRDSFGNTLLPFFAEEYGSAVFSKAIPYTVEPAMKERQTNTVIVECVERNLSQFAKEPPLMTGRNVTLDSVTEADTTTTTIQMQLAEQNAEYITIRGFVDETYITGDDKVYLSVEAEGQKGIFEAFTVSDAFSDYGYLLYLPVDVWGNKELDVCIMVGNEEEAQIVYSGKQVM